MSVACTVTSQSTSCWQFFRSPFSSPNPEENTPTDVKKVPKAGDPKVPLGWSKGIPFPIWI